MRAYITKIGQFIARRWRVITSYTPKLAKKIKRYIKAHWVRFALLGYIIGVVSGALYVALNPQTLDWHEGFRNIALGLTAVIGAPFVVWRIRIASQNSLTTIFAKAVEQIGATQGEKDEPNIAVRLGGLYALEALAKDNADYHHQVMEIIASYIRHNAPNKDENGDNAPNDDQRPINPPRIDIQTALTIIGRRNVDHESEDYQIELQHANLQDAQLWHANLQHANLQHAWLWNANLQGVQLWCANLQHAQLWRANLQHANLQGANLQDAELLFVNLQHAWLQHANLQGANLQGANLQGANLRGAKGLACAQLQQAKHWQRAYRDEDLACGEAIPDIPEDDPEAE